MAHESQHHRHQAFTYTNFSSANDFVTHSFPPSHEQELYSLPAAPGMEFLGIPPKPDHNIDDDHTWRVSFPMTGTSSFAAASGYLQTPEVMATTAPLNPWKPPNRMLRDVGDSSARFLFPSNGQPSSGLSLSLNQAEPSNSGYDQPLFRHRVLSNSRDNLLEKPLEFQQQNLKSSKYLIPARQLLNEFCSLNTSSISGSSKQKASVAKRGEEGASSSSSTLNQALYGSLEPHELKARKAKLLWMLEEVDRRYRKYREQMKAVVSSFEEMAGEGAATVYLTLSSKIMSRHFRCLKDAISGQIQAIRRATGEKDDAAALGATKGETPRLKLIDQCIRQHRAFQQTGMMESHPWRPQRGLPERSVSILRAWLFEHFLSPYPSDVDKHILARQAGLSRSQVSNWFINARVRLWKPMVEEMYLEETKEQEKSQTPQEHNYYACQVETTEEQKPLTGAMLSADHSDSLSCIISNSSGRRDRTNSQAPHTAGEHFGVIDMDFASQWGSRHSSGSGSVSLTLGLQQHNGGGGVSLSFSPPVAAQQSLLFTREQMEECQPSQLPSILDGGETQNLRYRNLMGAQVMRDLAG
ncbi:hypothetical protein Cni_G16218 [Canna indica]|uniref:Homeobox domain-containing protein n=1 Tax=Canna indica TaxID=4628 RepID=A0AAQ3KFW3_9LILI|nr:hypothetical protein Cni_G16218 [Canna indica]